MCEENPDIIDGGEPEPMTTITLMLGPDDAERFRKAVRHWEVWHNCKGYAEHFDATAPEAAAEHRGAIVMDAIAEWEDAEGIDLDAMEFDRIGDFSRRES